MKRLLLRFWPWRRIAELEKELQDKLAEATQQIIAANDRYHTAYTDGFRHHLQNWMAQANVFYGAKPFTDGQNKLMIHLYGQGKTFREALDYLQIAEGRERGRTFTN